LWLVPVKIKTTENDILVRAKDNRFQPSYIDKEFIRKLSKPGKPEQWEGKAPWWRPTEDKQKLRF